MSDKIGKAILDGHVHIHPPYQIDDFLNTAHDNLAASARKIGISKGDYFLLFTECAGDDYFGALAGLPNDPRRVPNTQISPEEWRIRPTAEDEAIVAESGERQLTIISGCQIAAKEGLEVLLLGTRQRIDDGLPIRDVLVQAQQLQVPYVIPWGPGKWFFSRGRLLNQLISEFHGTGLFLGDEGGRPWFWPRPGHMRTGEQVGVFDIPGTDPLPFAHDVSKVGKMGLVLDIQLDEHRPAASIRGALLGLKRQPQRFARLEPLFRFFQNQFAMQLRKHGIAFQNS